MATPARGHKPQRLSSSGHNTVSGAVFPARNAALTGFESCPKSSRLKTQSAHAKACRLSLARRFTVRVRSGVSTKAFTRLEYVKAFAIGGRAIENFHMRLMRRDALGSRVLKISARSVPPAAGENLFQAIVGLVGPGPTQRVSALSCPLFSGDTMPGGSAQGSGHQFSLIDWAWILAPFQTARNSVWPCTLPSAFDLVSPMCRRKPRLWKDFMMTALSC